MSIPDLINAAFEGFGAGFVCLHILKLYQNKLVRGVNWIATAYFTLWGFWNIFYYSNLDQWASWVCGIVLCVVNVTYLSMVLYYLKKEKNEYLHP